MNSVSTNIRSIVLTMGSWWTAVIRAFAILSGSVYPAATMERRLGGEPHYDGEDDQQEAINYDQPAEWKQAGGARVVAGLIKKHAEKLIGGDWPVVALRLSEDEAERRVAIGFLKIRMAERTGCNIDYASAVCYRWYEKKYITHHKETLSREFKINHYMTVTELIQLSGWGQRKERETRSEIYTVLDDAFSSAKKRLVEA